MPEKKYQTFKDFYPFYLSQHRNKTCRLLHVVGSSIIVLLLIYTIATQEYMLLLLIPVIGYGFAWVGHFAFEENVPATFTYPVYSLMGDFVMWWQVLTGKIKL